MRFLPTAQSFPYIPPLSGTDAVPTQTYSQQSSVTQTTTNTTQNQYSVSVTVSGAVKLIFTASLKVSDTME